MNTLNIQDGIEVVQCRQSLRLDNEAQLVIGPVQVVTHLIPPGGPGQRRAHAPLSPGRVVNRAGAGRRLLRSVDHGDDKGLDTHFQELLEQGRIRAHRPDQGGAGVGLHSPQVGHDIAQFKGCMFMIDQQPIKTGPRGDFRHIGIRQAQPAAPQGCLVTQPLQEFIFRQVHVPAPS